MGQKWISCGSYPHWFVGQVGQQVWSTSNADVYASKCLLYIILIKSVNHHDPPIGVVHVCLYKQKELKSVSKNSKTVKKACTCKVEVTNYPYQHGKAVCKRLVSAAQQTCKISIDGMAITAELPGIIVTKTCDIRVWPCVWCACYNMYYELCTAYLHAYLMHVTSLCFIFLALLF